MKYKHLAVILAIASFSLPVFNAVAQTEKPATTTPPSSSEAAASVAAEDGDDLKMFRFIVRMDKLDFVKKGMGLSAEEEKKFLSVYYFYDTELKLLNDKRLAVINDYAANFDNMTNAKADGLVKRMFEFRKQRSALLVKYYAKVAKATSKIIAARFLQVESVLQGAGDVVIGSSLPLMPK
jgi:hypothetical protein